MLNNDLTHFTPSPPPNIYRVNQFISSKIGSGMDSPLSLVKLCPHTKFQLPRRCISDLALFPPHPPETDRVKKFRGSKSGSGLTFLFGEIMPTYQISTC